MAWQHTSLDGVWVYEPNVFYDERGYFFESFNQNILPTEWADIKFVQDNESKSSFGVLRGLHYQTKPFAQSKLVRCVTGELLDVVVDIRSGSPSYGKHLTFLLSEVNKKQVFIPQGFAHGYVVLSEEAIFAYKCDQFYNKESEGIILFKDQTLNINYNTPTDQLIISAKDLAAPPFGQHIPFV